MAAGCSARCWTRVKQIHYQIRHLYGRLQIMPPFTQDCLRTGKEFIELQKPTLAQQPLWFRWVLQNTSNTFLVASLCQQTDGGILYPTNVVCGHRNFGDVAENTNDLNTHTLKHI